jgi:hypothetical protein
MSGSQPPPANTGREPVPLRPGPRTAAHCDDPFDPERLGESDRVPKHALVFARDRGVRVERVS